MTRLCARRGRREKETGAAVAPRPRLPQRPNRDALRRVTAHCRVAFGQSCSGKIAARCCFGSERRTGARLARSAEPRRATNIAFLERQESRCDDSRHALPPHFLLLLALLVGDLATAATAQPKQDFSNLLHWRNIGPFRGGRTRAISGVPSQPNVFYFAQVNGGVFKTNDYGRTWQPIFDDQPTGSVGALAVSVSDPNIIYVGSGEGLHRPDLSVGDGTLQIDRRGQNLDASRPARRPADRADRGRSAQSRSPAGRGRRASLWA